MLHLIELARIEALQPRVDHLIGRCRRLRRERAKREEEAAAAGGGPVSSVSRVEAAIQLDSRFLFALASPDASARARFNACSHLVECGEVGRALVHLADLMDVDELRADVEGLIVQCRRMRALRSDARRGRGWPHNARIGEGYAAISAGSDTTVLCFTGRGAIFGISSYFMRGLLDLHNVNSVYLFDWRDAGYLGGIAGLGNTFGESVAGLKRLCRDLGTRRLIALGVSLGGYGAMRVALELRADATLALGPQLRGVLDGHRLAVIREVLGAPVDPESIDLRHLYARASDPPLTWIVYGADNDSDTRCAAHMRGLRGVVEHPLPGVSEHTVLRRLALDGEFTPLFARFLDSVGPGSWSERMVDA